MSDFNVGNSRKVPLAIIELSLIKEILEKVQTQGKKDILTNEEMIVLRNNISEVLTRRDSALRILGSYTQ